MNTTGLTQFITGWRGYILGARPQWYPHQRVEGIRAGWLIAGGAHQVAQFKRVATLLGTIFTGGAKLWVYGLARFHLGGVRPRREADYQDTPGQHPWGRSYALWRPGHLSNSMYVRWRRTRAAHARSRVVRPGRYRWRRRGLRRRRQQRGQLARRWARLRRRGRLPRGCYRGQPWGTLWVRRWWSSRVGRSQPWSTHPRGPVPRAWQRRGGYPRAGWATLGFTGLRRRWATALVGRHRRRRRWRPALHPVRWGTTPGGVTRPVHHRVGTTRRAGRLGGRPTRWVRRFEGWPHFFPGVVALGNPGGDGQPTFTGEAAAAGVPTVLWGTGVRPEWTPWVVAWPHTRVDGLARWITTVWLWSRGAALLGGVARRVGGSPT